MTLCRRDFLHLALGSATLPVLSKTVQAQTYPSRSVRFIVGFPAGSGADIVARLLGQSLSERLGQRFAVENRPGAGSNVGTELVARAPPDGYTLLLVGSTNAISASLYPDLNFDFLRDIVPVAGVARGPFIMVINPSLPTRTVPEFVAYAKANPGKITMASPGVGSGNHIFGALFAMMSGIDLVHIPYRGGFLPDLLSGQVQISFTPIQLVVEYIRTGKLRALAVTGGVRLDMLPEIPTVGEFLPGYEASGWLGVGAPKNTPIEIVERLNKEISALVTNPAFAPRLVAFGNVPMPMKPTELGTFITSETEKWSTVIRAGNIKPE
jgi:tripartite-type tricarboxylate transporter receptor subunit TctC